MQWTVCRCEITASWTAYSCAHMGTRSASTMEWLAYRASEYQGEKGLTQRLTLACLNNRTLSSFRLTLLALTRVEYSDAGAEKLNQFMDACSIVWTPASSPDEAHAMETSELKNSDYHYPLNDAHHKRPVLKTCRASLRAPRAAYRRQYLS